MNSRLIDGPPTGRLNAHDMMEISLFIDDNGKRVPCGTRWITVTPEQRRVIEGKNKVVVSMGVSQETVDNVLNDKGGPAYETTFVTGVPDSSGQVLSSEAVASLDAQLFRPLTGHLSPDASTQQEALNPASTRSFESLKAQSDLAARYPYAVPKPKLGEWVDAAGLDMDKLHADMKQDAKIAGTFPAFTVDAKNRVTSADRRVIQGERRAENSGGNVNYYSVRIDHPKRPERPPYTFEVEDLIQALNMTFGEGTVLKSLVRSCVEREFGIGKVGGDYVRDAEKMVHSSKEVLRDRMLRKAAK